MPDFNKGDFTQQGVNGHVNATVRLNEKRLVSIDLTSNEEAEGCTITGTVKDLLNDKVYGVGSGVSGNIEITENGENINVAPYATATVNVPSSGMDFVIPEQTINTPDTGRVFIESDFPVPLTDNIIVQLIGAAYGQPIHALLICGKNIDEGGNAQYTGIASSRIGGTTMTMKLNLSKVAIEEYWGVGIYVNDVQTAFSNVLISAIAEWETTPH